MIPRTGSRPDSSSVLRIARHLIWASVLLAGLLFLASPAAAEKPCGQAVIDDWYGNGRVDDAYPIQCYREALKRLPDDVQNYSDAPDVIQRALQDAIRKEQEPPPQSPPEPADTTPDESGAVPSGGGDEPPGGGGSAGPSDSGSEQPRPSGGGEEPESPGDTNGVLGEAIGKLGSGSADSVPVPLLIIGGLALLLLAGGSAGLVARRLQARRIPRDRLDEPRRPRRPRA